MYQRYRYDKTRLHPTKAAPPHARCSGYLSSPLSCGLLVSRLALDLTSPRCTRRSFFLGLGLRTFFPPGRDNLFLNHSRSLLLVTCYLLCCVLHLIPFLYISLSFLVFGLAGTLYVCLFWLLWVHYTYIFSSRLALVQLFFILYSFLLIFLYTYFSTRARSLLLTFSSLLFAYTNIHAHFPYLLFSSCMHTFLHFTYTPAFPFQKLFRNFLCFSWM
jgi:hypothetical protein